jgi:predicted pyridoxine 5'-phosphate oxidase superfamily flavin-nucleotide-binding protein
MVIAQEPTQSLAALHRPLTVDVCMARAQQALEDLASIYKPPHNNVLRKVTDHITEPGRAFIAASPFLVLATAGKGGIDCSPNPALLSRFMVAAKLPRAVLVVTVEEAYSHCPKALVRSDLWRAAAAGRPQAAPSHGQFAAYRDGGDDAYARKYDAEYAERIREHSTA